MTTPIRWIENTYHYFRRGIGRSNWRWYNHPLQFLRGKVPHFRGYVALSQPRYRPGDTLELKAYLTNRKAKPWNRAVSLRIAAYSSFHGRQIALADTLLESTAAGHFNYAQVLSDSLPLDLQYQITFDHPRKDRFETLNHRFLLEDYELDEAEFYLTMEQNVFHRGESIRFKVEGKDQNDQFVADAQVQLLLLVDAIKGIYRDSLSIPDTLWGAREALRSKETTPLSIPDSIFPPADLKLRLEANFLHPSGEMHQKQTDFSFLHHWDELVLKVENDSIRMEYERDGESVPITAYLQRSSSDESEVLPQLDTIALPHREALQSHISTYTLRTENLKKQLQLGKTHQSKVSVSGYWQPDTITLVFQNPRRLPITWMLQSRTREIRRSIFTDTYGEVKVPVSDRAEWKLSYQYFWEQSLSEEIYINRLDKQLTIAVEQPARVSPGEKVPIRVQVKDPYGRPAAAVQLTAAAVNSQFGETKDAYRAPDITYKRKRAPFILQSFRLEDFDWRDSDRRMMNKAWYEKLGMAEESFYHMRYQNEGVWTQRDTLTQDSFYHGIAQVAPYLIRNGKAVPIYLIYINHDLVYFYGANHSKPYSFAGQPGYNLISLRTLTAEYQLDSVWLEPGQKLEVALHLDRFPLGTRQKGIRLSASVQPDHLTYKEKQVLRNRMIALRPQQGGLHYLWDHPTNLHTVSFSNTHWNRQKEVILGPFGPNAILHHVRQNHWERQFVFEPGFIYEIDKTRERLYEWDSWPQEETIALPPKLPLTKPGEYLLRPRDIVRETPVQHQIFFDKNAPGRISGQGRLQLFNQPSGQDSLQILAHVLVAETGTEQVIQPKQTLVGDLSAGNYILFVARADGRVSKNEFYLASNKTLAIDLANTNFVPDTLRHWPDRLFSYSLTRRIERKKEKITTTTIRPYTGKQRLVRGQITDSDGEPLIGAIVLIKGTTVGTITDFDGYYEISLPADAEAVEINYVGFNLIEFQLDGSTELNIRLEESTLNLQEVIVAGYGTSRKQNLTAAVSTVLEGRTAGVAVTTVGGEVIRLRGSSTIGGTEPLIIINGQIISSEELSKIPPGLIEAAEVVNDAAMQTLYGARAAGGVLMIKLREDGLMTLPEPEPLDAATSLRNNFRDHAFWQPHLITDENGEAFFQATYPDNITAWDTYVLGMDRRQRVGVGLARTQAWKPLVARLSVPRFMVAGDQAGMIGQAINYESDSLAIQTFFQQNGREVSRREHVLKSSLLEGHSLSAPTTGDSITVAYGLIAEGETDGEERHIPIFPQGSLETIGFFAVLSGDTTLDLTFDRKEPVTIFAADNALELLLQDLNYLEHYPQACMEQTASRLIAFCLDKSIKEQLGKTFSHERDIRKMINRLEKAQQPDGSWGWWPGNAGSYWITMHVLKALQLAGWDETSYQAYSSGLRFLVNDIARMDSRQQLAVLDFLSSLKHPMDYDQILAAHDTLQLDLHDRLLTQLVRQRMGLDMTLDTLYHYRQETLYGAHFWGSAGGQYLGPGNAGHSRINTSLLAYELLKNEGRSQEAARVLQYFLEKRGVGREHGRPGWYNTYETARVLVTILPDLLGKEKRITPNKLILEMNAEQHTIDRFPYRISQSDIRNLRVLKTGTTPLYFTTYQQYHETQPTPKADVFQISSSLLQGEQEVTAVKKGQSVLLEVGLEMKTEAEYVMVEVPIPAGCSYENRAERSNRWEVHREYQREKVAIFCEKLPAGEHTFRIQLEPRFNGLFTLNPARAEQMYFPVLFGRNEMRRMRIEP